MSKSVALLLVLVFLTASCIMAKPAFSSADLVEDSWASKAPMHQARAGLGVVAVNGKIYAIGGMLSTRYPPKGFVGTNEEYNPETDTWITKASMPTPRAYFAIAAHQNEIYCIGGLVGIRETPADPSLNLPGFVTTEELTVGQCEVYDTVTNTWKRVSSMPKNAQNIQAHVVNGKIYVIDAAFTYVYDPVNDSWTSKTRMPPVSSPMSVVVGNKIIVTGENTTEIRWGVESSEQEIFVYDTETDSWSDGRSGSIVVGQGAAGATIGTRAPQRVYVLGLAIKQWFPSPVSQVYDPETDTWITANPMPAKRSHFGVAVLNDILYVIGGYFYPSYLKDGVVIQRPRTLSGMNEQYIPIGYSPLPQVEIVSPVRETYNESSVSLVFTLNKPVNWLGYSLDGQDNVTVTGNTTLSELANGLHNITVYAKDEFENTGASETITFKIDVPFPTALVAVASVAAVAVIGVGLLVYFRKRSRRTEKRFVKKP
jgi:N-acetylneuraminic acid mutarotase